MPDTSGMDLAKLLKANGHGAPMVMISADAREGKQFPDQRLPVDEYLVKPVRVSTLKERLAKLLMIDWVYHEDAVALPLHYQPKVRACELPDYDLLVELRKMAEIGHLQGLRKKLLELKKSARYHPSFLHFLEESISKLNFDSIVNLERVASCD